MKNLLDVVYAVVMAISQFDFDQMQRRCNENAVRGPAAVKTPVQSVPADAVPDGEEGKLHEEIISELRRRRWLFIHSRMDKKSTVQPGTPDFSIFPPGKDAFFVECKTKTGKLSEEQTVFKHCAEASGYRFLLCRSLTTFLEEADCQTSRANPQ